MAGLTGTLQRAVRSSVVGSALNSLDADRMVSTVQSIGTQLTDLGKNSYLFRWLTAEPEPEVVVINLRETWTLGPVLSLLEKTVGSCQPYWCDSALSAALDEIVATTEDLSETRIGHVLGRILLPTEPPLSVDDQDES